MQWGLELTSGICTTFMYVATGCVINFSGGVAPTEVCKPPGPQADHSVHKFASQKLTSGKNLTMAGQTLVQYYYTGILSAQI